ncbi:ECF RNA polymerase sigma factor SigK [Methylobacterium hispanicum]|uniref:ECF RNA polymerase sigma factor SigK n=1 Tax=Methylobacterium hispanicum TaxID=270350 RepID=A0AAV4ZV36_9HYPH|nr:MULTISPECIES: sigma-70 family RNA polymerase sigma factor [Methylobacterium]GJD92392.1 ECF RNA polymerase sigma factor SigK [Methylobacterium hispanicum]
MEPFDHASALEGCARQDPASLRRLYDREAGFLLAVALRIVRRRDVAVEVVHDSFLDIWERAGSFDSSRGAGRAWIASIVRHRALKYIRAAGRETDIDEAKTAEIVDTAPDPFAALAAAQDGARLHACLAKLDADRRRVILLAYVEGLSQSEIAERLATPLGTVKAWVRRSLIALKDCLS